jgi:hypothetical protein
MPDRSLRVVTRARNDEPGSEIMLLIVESDRDLHITASFFKATNHDEKIRRIFRAIQERDRAEPT